MKLLDNATLRKKLLYLVIASGAIAMLIIVMSYLGMNTMHDSVGTIYRDRVVPLAHLKKVSDYYAVNIVDATHKVRNSELTYKEGMASIYINISDNRRKTISGESYERVYGG
jgi:methyl-accepting chemotaxis protein